MKKKLVLSLAAAAMVGTLAVGGTLAWFTDTEDVYKRQLRQRFIRKRRRRAGFDFFSPRGSGDGIRTAGFLRR